MKGPFKLIKIILLASLLIFCSWQGIKIFQGYHHKQFIQTQLVNELSAKVRLDNISGELIKWIDNEIFGSADKKNQGYAQEIKKIQQSILDESLTFLFASFLLITLNLWSFSLRTLSTSLILLSLICLSVGLTIPILTIESSQELPLLGKTILQFESKGILYSIQNLFSSGNNIVAYILVLFSVIFPVIKSLVSLWASIAEESIHPQQASKLISHLGKWSMTDVFVVAILIVFFASSQHSLTQSNLEYGLYFFSAYTLLALLTSQFTLHKK